MTVAFQQHKLFAKNARTLPADCIGINTSGWTITGEIQQDYYKWVSAFEAVHPRWGRVWGDFDSMVYASSKRAYAKFCESHPVESWDYDDI